MSEGKNQQQTQAINLSTFLDESVLPRLSADQIFTHHSHNFHKSDQKWRGGCPWHASKSGSSFTVNPQTLQWWCQGCGVGGGAIQYLDRLANGNGSPRGVDFINRCRQLCEWADVPFPERKVSPEEAEKARRREARRAILQSIINYCQQNIPQNAREYLHSRGLSDDDITNLGIGYYSSAKKTKNLLEKQGHDLKTAYGTGVLNHDMEGYTTFPWMDDHGRPLTIYGRWHEKVPPPGKPKTLALNNPKWGDGVLEHTKRSPLYLDRAIQNGHADLVLFEGVLDGALYQARGITNAVACVAAQLSKLQTETLKKRGIKSVTICLDPDSGGDSGTQSCIKSLSAVGIEAFVAPRLPDGLDPDEFLLAHGIDGWKAHVSKSVHAQRYKAQILCSKHKQGDEWTDQGLKAVIEDAITYCKSITDPKIITELDRFFIPEIIEQTGISKSLFRNRLSVEQVKPLLGSPFGEVSIEDLRISRFLEAPPQPIKCLFKKSLPLKTLGYWVSNGGLGKGFSLLQSGISVASGMPLFDGVFDIETPGKAFLVFGEDQEEIIHHRLHSILNSLFVYRDLPNVMRRLNENLFIKCVSGEDVRLMAPVNGVFHPSLAFWDLLELLTSIPDLRLVALDPISRFFVGNENDASESTYFCSLLELIAKETGAAVVATSHTSKASGRGKNALIQEALRGSSGFTNAARWQLNMAAVDESEAKTLRINKEEVPRHLWAKVTKKNYGPPEMHFLLRRDDHGVLRRVAIPDVDLNQEVKEAIITKVAELKAAGESHTADAFSRKFKKTWEGFGYRKLKGLITQCLVDETLTLVPGKSKNNHDVVYLELPE
jgi:DNA primase catalytic core